jgi:beta-lactam-binding protein with PASTA domain
VPAGDVISQSPVACTACATSGDAVDLVVSSGPENSAPTIVISSPEDHAVIPSGTSVVLVATASDAEDGPITANITWVSSKNGVLGTGETLIVDLNRGSHTITATVTDSGGLEATDSIKIRVSKD